MRRISLRQPKQFAPPEQDECKRPPQAGASQFINFSKVSKTEQRQNFDRPHVVPITAPPSASIGDRECCMLPPDRGMRHAPNPIRFARLSKMPQAEEADAGRG
jgi:hypothetical protein